MEQPSVVMFSVICGVFVAIFCVVIISNKQIAKKQNVNESND